MVETETMVNLGNQGKLDNKGSRVKQGALVREEQMALKVTEDKMDRMVQKVTEVAMVVEVHLAILDKQESLAGLEKMVKRERQASMVEME